MTTLKINTFLSSRLNQINMKKNILLFCVIAVWGCNSPKEKPNPKYELEAVEEMIKKCVYDIDSKEVLALSLTRLDSIILQFPNTKEANRAKYLLSKKDSINTLFDKVQLKKQIANDEILLPERKAYQETLRNLFLDKGLDIKVTVSGDKYDKMLLEFVLFSDVWFRKFETNGDFDNWSKLGFKEITLSDKNTYRKSMQYQ